MNKNLDEVIDVIIVVDGTWQKRGHTSLYGVIVVTAWLTGQVLAIEVLSKYCQECKMKKASMIGVDFEAWHADHEEKEKCDINHKGSSNSMEVQGVKKIWARSVADLKLRFTTYIGDGDSKAFNTLVADKPYGPDVALLKHECVGHVGKRMGTALRNLKKKGAIGDDGRPVKFKGRLTNENIKKLNVYYGGAIRNAGGSVDNMVIAIDASFLHSCSVHTKCLEHNPPQGKFSWCKFKKAEYNKLPVPTHSKSLIPPDLAKYIIPVYRRLAHRDLLERCTLGATQNQNESILCGCFVVKLSL